MKLLFSLLCLTLALTFIGCETASSQSNTSLGAVQECGMNCNQPCCAGKDAKACSSTCSGDATKSCGGNAAKTCGPDCTKPCCAGITNPGALKDLPRSCPSSKSSCDKSNKAATSGCCPGK